MNEGLNKMWYKQKMDSYPALKRKEILTHATAQMNLEKTVLRKISQSQKDKYYMIPLI